MTDLEADSAVALRMHSAQPLDILADELGAATGRIERELRLKDEARAARFEARLAAIELAAFKAEEERQRKFEARIAELRDGKDGKDGEPGRDGKNADIAPLVEAFSSLEDEWENKICQRLDSVKDGIDGKDGEPGKDADITPLIVEFDKLKSEIQERSYESIVRVESAVLEVRDGKDGQDGKDGEQGPPGKDGQDGKMPIAREWTNRVHYAGDVVRHNGSTYQALADTGREPPHSDWGELASRGTDGRGFLLRGTYDASVDYLQYDIVMINRNSFAAKYDSPGECPGEGWQLFGPSGQRGKEGPPGAKGMDGRSVSIANVESDPDAMVIKITDSLGKTFTVDLGPIAERIVEAVK